MNNERQAENNFIDKGILNIQKGLEKMKIITNIFDSGINNILSIKKWTQQNLLPLNFKNQNNYYSYQQKTKNKQNNIYYKNHDKYLYLNEKQKDTFKEFQIKNQHLNLTSNTLIRYLAARNWDQQKAQDMLNASLKWYQEIDLENLYTEDFPDFDKLGSYFYLGQGKNKCPVVYHDSAVLFPSTFDHKRFTKYFFACMQNTVRKMEGNIETYIVIMDVNNITLQNIDLGLASHNISNLEKYYPERIEKFYIVNNTQFTLYITSLLKHVIPGRTFQKIQFLGKNQQENLQVLQQQIDISNIPAKIGGKSKII